MGDACSNKKKAQLRRQKETEGRQGGHSDPQEGRQDRAKGDKAVTMTNKKGNKKGNKREQKGDKADTVGTRRTQ